MSPRAFAFIVVVLIAPAAAAQESPAIVDASSLERISAALASAPAVEIKIVPPFYALTVAKPFGGRESVWTWGPGTVPPAGPEIAASNWSNRDGFGGIDVLEWIRGAVDAYRQHQAAAIRHRIDRELQTFNRK